MPENTIATPLLGALRALLWAHRPAFGQERTFLRAQALILGHLFVALASPDARSRRP